MKIYQYSDFSSVDIQALCQRKGVDLEALFPRLKPIQQAIKTVGDAAVKKYTMQFDGVLLDQFLVSAAEFEAANRSVSAEFKAAIEVARKNIRTFHEAQICPEKKVETTPGVICWRERRAIESVGLYIPGGTAPLFSTLLMTAIPAQIAGCQEIVVCTPPRSDGSVSPEILYTAQLLGLKSLYKVGGAQAIFALAAGTESIPKVDKIFGPGNQYVTAAKTMVSRSVAIDMPAGPSEVLVMADQDSNPELVASDLLAQAEHGADSEVVLVVNSDSKVDEILQALEEQLAILPRKNIAQKALEHSFVVITQNLKQAFEFSNAYAPEHLILTFQHFEPWLQSIRSAGSVFCGPLSAESFGDYASGTNHVLPTSGFARSYSGVSVESFLKQITFQAVTPLGCQKLGKTVEILAEKEALQAHKNAVTLRLKSLNSKC